MNAALAIFVKTPGLSPVKTRLAAEIGERAALEFYEQAVAAVGAVAVAAQTAGLPLTPYWAVAEQQALALTRWHAFPRVWQGEDGLGERLDRVHACLHRNHDRVLLVGADAPQITVDLLRRTLAALAQPETPFAMGRASDGGFWIFASRQVVPSTVWTSIRYSRSYTARSLAMIVRASGNIADLPVLTDVDVAADLAVFRAELAELAAPLPEQVGLRFWLDGLGLGPTHGANS